MVSKKLKLFTSMANPRGICNILLHGLRRIGTLMGRAFVGPVQLRINPLSYSCNNRCPMCDLRSITQEKLEGLKMYERKNMLKLKEYRNLFQNRLPGLISVNVTGGGEPLLHPEILGIMREIKKQNLRGSLITNGVLMNEKTSRQIINMRWDGVRISMHAGDRETYKKICGTDNFKKVKKNMMLFNKITSDQNKWPKCKLVMFNVIHRENINTAERIFTVAEEVGADYIEFDRLIPFAEKLRLMPLELRNARQRLFSCAKDSSVPCNLDSIVRQLKTEESTAWGGKRNLPAKRCSVGFDQMFITSLGDVFPCCFSDEVMGNIQKQSLKEIWNGRQFSFFRKELIQGKFRAYCLKNRCTLPGVLHNW